MAIEKNIRINVDTKGAVSEVDKLEDSFKSLDKETEKTSKGLKDVGENGGAIAILDSLTGGLATRVRDAYEATKLFNFSLKGTRAALIATGVGAFLVALGAILVYWKDIEEAIKGTTENLQTQLDLTKAVQSNLDLQVKNIEKQLELGKLQGKTNEQLEAQKVALLERLQEQNTAEQQLIEKQLARLKGTAQEVSFWDSIAANVKFTLFGAQGLADTATKLSGERLAAIKALEDQLEAAKGQALDLELTLFKIANPNADSENAKLAKGFELESGLTPNDLIIFTSAELLNERLNQLGLERLTNEEITQEGINAIRQANLDNAASAFGLLSQLAGKNKELQAAAIIGANAAGIAQNIIDTNAANARLTLEAGLAAPALITANFVRMGIGIASSIAATAQGLSALGASGVGGGVSGGAGGRGGSQAPSFNLVQGSATNQIANSLQRSNEPVKAFVVSKDITSRQELDRTIQMSSTL